MIVHLIKKYFNNYVNTVVLTTDSKALKLKKSSLIMVPLIIVPAALVWGILYIFLGQYLSASIPLSYSVISLFNLWHVYKTENIILLQQIQMIKIPKLLKLHLKFFSSFTPLYVQVKKKYIINILKSQMYIYLLFKFLSKNPRMVFNTLLSTATVFNSPNNDSVLPKNSPMFLKK